MALSTSTILRRFARRFADLGRALTNGGEWGSGSGKGGGSGGSVREAGGSFGKMEAAREEEYFRKMQSEQLAALKKHIGDEISHHKTLIDQHKDAIERLESRVTEMSADIQDEIGEKRDEEEKHSADMQGEVGEKRDEEGKNSADILGEIRERLEKEGKNKEEDGKDPKC